MTDEKWKSTYINIFLFVNKYISTTFITLICAIQNNVLFKIIMNQEKKKKEVTVYHIASPVLISLSVFQINVKWTVCQGQTKDQRPRLQMASEINSYFLTKDPP